MLTAPLIVLSMSYPPVVYETTGGYLILKTVRGAANINYCWIPYV
jgi:hypothetical protein